MWVNKLLIAVAKILIAGVVFFGALFIYGYYQARPVKAFCAEVSKDTTPTEILALASKMELPVFDLMKEKNSIVVLNHNSPMFRMACKIEFKDNKIISKGVTGAD
jgi:hypothetical protein